MTAIAAIETEYAGYRFRSRLEARWAVFFTRAGYCWEYEPEGFELSGGVRYLPDFRVRCGPPGRTRVMWYEVKPPGVLRDEKFTAFCRALLADKDDGDMSAPDALLLAGDPLEYLQTNEVCPRCGALEIDIMPITPNRPTALIEPYRQDDDEYVCSCLWCDSTTPVGGDHPEEAGWMCSVRPHKGLLVVRADAYLLGHFKLLNAARAARAERFNKAAA